MSTLKEIVETRLAELDLGPVEAAVSGGIERTYIRDIIENRKKSVRNDKLAGLARALKLDPAALSRGELLRADDADAGIVAHGRPSVRLVRVKSHVQAGAWEETWELPLDEQYEVPVQADADLAAFSLFAAETRGPSMNRRYPEGTVVVFTDAIETGEDIQIGKRYVVERERADGLREATVKKLWQDDAGKLWLLPESDDPRFQEPIPVEGNEDDTIRVVGRVRYAVSKE